MLTEIQKQLGGRKISQEIVSAHFKERSFEGLLIPSYRSFKTKIDNFGSFYSIQFNINSKLAFSVNNPDHIFRFTKKVSLENFSFPVFVSESNEAKIKDQSLKKFFSNLGFFLLELGFLSEESIYFYSNRLDLSIKVERFSVQILNNTIDFINSYPEVFFSEKKEKIRIKLPDQFKDLLPLLKKNAISDDSDRSLLKEELKPRERKRILTLVTPRLDDIDIYLNSFKDDALDEGAMLLGSLAELARELTLED